MKPEKIIQVGKCRASIFRNPVQKGGKTIDLPKVKFEIRYKDKTDGRWKGTSSMTLSEIPLAILALAKAYDAIASK